MVLVLKTRGDESLPGVRIPPLPPNKYQYSVIVSVWRVVRVV